MKKLNLLIFALVICLCLSSCSGEKSEFSTLLGKLEASINGNNGEGVLDLMRPDIKEALSGSDKIFESLAVLFPDIAPLIPTSEQRRTVDITVTDVIKSEDNKTVFVYCKIGIGTEGTSGKEYSDCYFEMTAANKSYYIESIEFL